MNLNKGKATLNMRLFGPSGVIQVDDFDTAFLRLVLVGNAQHDVSRI